MCTHRSVEEIHVRMRKRWCQRPDELAVVAGWLTSCGNTYDASEEEEEEEEECGELRC